jgi:hypothetical protein
MPHRRRAGDATLYAAAERTRKRGIFGRDRRAGTPERAICSQSGCHEDSECDDHRKCDPTPGPAHVASCDGKSKQEDRCENDARWGWMNDADGTRQRRGSEYERTIHTACVRTLHATEPVRARTM